MIGRVVPLADYAAGMSKSIIDIQLNCLHVEMCLACRLGISDSLFDYFLGFLNELAMQIYLIIVNSSWRIVLPEDEFRRLFVELMPRPWIVRLPGQIPKPVIFMLGGRALAMIKGSRAKLWWELGEGIGHIVDGVSGSSSAVDSDVIDLRSGSGSRCSSSQARLWYPGFSLGALGQARTI